MWPSFSWRHYTGTRSPQEAVNWPHRYTARCLARMSLEGALRHNRRRPAPLQVTDVCGRREVAPCVASLAASEDVGGGVAVDRTHAETHNEVAPRVAAVPLESVEKVRRVILRCPALLVDLDSVPFFPAVGHCKRATQSLSRQVRAHYPLKRGRSAP